MATASFTTPGTPLTMAALKTFLDAALGELLNRHRGASAPDSPIEGQLWWDTSGDPVDVLKRYTVAAGWISLLTVNKTTGVVTVQSLTLTAAATGFTIAGGTTSKTLTLDTDVTATNLMLKTGSNLAIGSDADGDMYYRASSVLARLAKGTADHKLFMNAGATAPEWAKGIAIVGGARNMASDTADVSYSGAGFKPSALIGFGAVSGTYITCFNGIYDGTTTNSICDNGAASAYTYLQANNFLTFLEAAGKMQSAIIKSLDADGYTLSWTRTGATASATITFYALCLR